MGSLTVGLGGSQQAGSRRDHSPSGGITGSLSGASTARCLEAPGIPAAQASHLQSKEENRGHELRVECRAFSTEGGWGGYAMSLVAGSRLLYPCMWVSELCSQQLPAGTDGTKPKGV